MWQFKNVDVWELDYWYKNLNMILRLSRDQFGDWHDDDGKAWKQTHCGAWPEAEGQRAAL